LIKAKSELREELRNQENLEFLEDYLKESRKVSRMVFNNQKSILLRCLNHINKSIKEISMLDIRDFLMNDIDKRDIKLDTKETYRSYLISFFAYIQKIELNKNNIFNNPVPSRKILAFTKYESDFKRISEEEDEIFTHEELLELLKMAKKEDYRDFIIFSLLTVDGMRINECLSIKTQDINLKERYIETGFEEGARKSNKGLIFFIPKRFVPFLEKYLINIGNSKWLFPGRRTHYTYDSFRKTTKSRYKKSIKFHTFRDTLITNRIKMGCPLTISEVLMNHKSTSVEGEHYLKLKISGKREFYDKYFPYSNFPYF